LIVGVTGGCALCSVPSWQARNSGVPEWPVPGTVVGVGEPEDPVGFDELDPCEPVEPVVVPVEPPACVPVVTAEVVVVDRA
jgi:hypothetical protein